MVIGLGLRERKKLDTRRALSDAALQLMFERGIDNVTREAIADLAGVSLRTFSNYFTGKYEAIAYRQTERVGRSIAALRQRPADEARVGGDGNSLRVESVRDIEKLTDFHKWKRVDFVHQDYEYINDRAYFDYQRERVYIRTSKSLKRRRAGRRAGLCR